MTHDELAAVAEWCRAVADGRRPETPDIDLPYGPESVAMRAFPLMGHFNGVLKDIPELLADPDVDSLSVWVEDDDAPEDEKWKKHTASARQYAEMVLANVRRACRTLSDYWERDSATFGVAIMLVWRGYAIGNNQTFPHHVLSEPQRSIGMKILLKSDKGAAEQRKRAEELDAPLVNAAKAMTLEYPGRSWSQIWEKSGGEEVIPRRTFYNVTRHLREPLKKPRA